MTQTSQRSGAHALRLAAPDVRKVVDASRHGGEISRAGPPEVAAFNTSISSGRFARTARIAPAIALISAGPQSPRSHRRHLDRRPRASRAARSSSTSR